jgi:hypothetical protein
MPLNPKVYLGATEIKRAYLGSTLLFDRTGPTAATIEGISGVVSVFVADPRYLYTDTAATTQVTADGDPVGAWMDTAELRTLTRVGSGVTYRDDGTHRWVESDGNGRLEGTVPDAWATPSFTAAVAAQRDTDDYRIVMAVVDSTEPADGYWFPLSHVSEDGIRPRYFTGSTNIDCWPSLSSSLSTPHVINAVEDAGANLARARLDGGADQDATQTGGFAAGLYPGGSNLVLSFFGEAGSSPQSNAARVYGAVWALGILSAADRDLIDQWLAGRSGVTL